MLYQPLYELLHEALAIEEPVVLHDMTCSMQTSSEQGEQTHILTACLLMTA